MKHLKNFFSRRYTLIFLLILLYFLTRVFFINSQGVFFDSQEYINLFINPNYIHAIILGHYPPHEGYFFLFWPIFHLAHFISLDGAYSVILIQIILSCITLYCFCSFIIYISDKRTALFATVLAALMPLFWIVNVTLMMENAYALYFFVSLYLLTLYLKRDKKLFLHISLFLYCMALLTQTIVVLWAPFYLITILMKKKQQVVKICILLFLYFGIFSAANILFISYAGGAPLKDVFYSYYLSKTGEFSGAVNNTHAILASGRNFLIPLLRNNTIVLAVLSLVSLIILLRKNKKMFFFGLLWIIPAIYANQWWDSLLMGRHALVASFGIAFLVALLIRKKSIFMIATIMYLLICSLPALNLLRYPIPYLQEASYVKLLPKDALFIESHFARPQVQSTVIAKTIYLNEPHYTSDRIKKAIDIQLGEKKPVFISGAALSEPYGLFSGPYIHNLTLSYVNTYTLASVIPHYTLKTYHVINLRDNLVIYQIISQKKSSYPKILQLQNSSRRIDYTDPVSWIFRKLEFTYF